MNRVHEINTSLKQPQKLYVTIFSQFRYYKQNFVSLDLHLIVLLYIRGVLQPSLSDPSELISSTAKIIYLKKNIL